MHHFRFGDKVKVLIADGTWLKCIYLGKGKMIAKSHVNLEGYYIIYKEKRKVERGWICQNNKTKY